MSVVLITGCSSGIGEATAADLVTHGHTVYATGRRPETLKSLADQGCHTLALDVTNEESMGAAVDDLKDGPYAEFNFRVGTVTAEIYAGSVAKFLGGTSDSVAEVVRKAIGAKRPKARDTVTPSATLSIIQRQLTPDARPIPGPPQLTDRQLS